MKTKILNPIKMMVDRWRLNLENMDESDAANYTCSAQNPKGQANFTFQLTIQCNKIVADDFLVYLFTLLFLSIRFGTLSTDVCRRCGK